MNGDRDPRVQPQAGEVMRGVDAQKLLEEAAEAVVGDVQRKEPGRLDPPPSRDPQQQQDAKDVPDQLVQKRRVERGLVDVLRGPVGNVDLQPPRQRCGLAEELLVPPVADPANPLREQQPWRGRIHERREAHARPPHDHPATGAPEDPALHAEPALRHLEDAFHSGSELAHRRGVVGRATTLKPTPHTATRMTRFESPPCRFQRTSARRTRGSQRGASARTGGCAAARH